MFENLEIYQKSVDFADRVVDVAGRFPRGYCLVDQLNRASLRVHLLFTLPAVMLFVGIAMGSMRR